VKSNWERGFRSLSYIQTRGREGLERCGGGQIIPEKNAKRGESHFSTKKKQVGNGGKWGSERRVVPRVRGGGGIKVRRGGDRGGEVWGEGRG